MSRRLLALTLVLPVPALAGDYASEPQELLFSDRFDAFDAIEFDTGSVPSGSPLAVRFYLKSWGGSYAEMEAVSTLEWPDALAHHVEGVPGTGLFELDCDLELAAQVTFDIWGYKGAYDVWSTRLELEDEVDFDPLLLPARGQPSVEASADGAALDTYEVEIPLFAGLEIQVVIDLFPRAVGQLAGSYIETNGQVQSRADVSTVHEVPEDDPGLLEMSSTYVANVASSLAIVVRPELEICAPIIGCFKVASFDIPVPLVDESAEERFGWVDYAHPLPALSAPITTHDFGDVDVDTLANLQLPLANIGRLDLEGWLRIEGDASFSVFPEYIQASEGNTDGTVITFSPSEPGVKTATLILESNDPSRPELRIPLAGNGWVEPTLDDPDDPRRLSGEVRGCGCTTGATPGGAAWAFGLVGLVLLGRRRRR
jgi:MYXO-CTERM domain-containing protein